MRNFVSVAARLPLVLRGIDGRPPAGDLGGLLHWLAITKNPLTKIGVYSGDVEKVTNF